MVHFRQQVIDFLLNLVALAAEAENRVLYVLFDLFREALTFELNIADVILVLLVFVDRWLNH